jgi:hypothetical protein
MNPATAVSEPFQNKDCPLGCKYHVAVFTNTLRILKEPLTRARNLMLLFARYFSVKMFGRWKRFEWQKDS